MPGPHELEEVAVRRDDRGVDPLRRRRAPRASRSRRRPRGRRRSGAPGSAATSSTSSIRPSCGLKSPGVSAPARLVVGVLLEADRRRARVERHGDQIRVLLGEELDQHRGEPVDGVRDGARCCVARVGGRAKNARYARLCPSSRKRRRGASGDVGGVTVRIVAAARDGGPPGTPCDTHSYPNELDVNPTSWVGFARVRRLRCSAASEHPGG